jgi:hypothetical protein
MKTVACFVFLLLGVAAFVPADTVNDLVAKGCPSPEREWQAKDYATVKELLANATIPLPRTDSESGKVVLRRLVDAGNFAFHRNRELPLEARVKDFLSLMDSTQGIMMLYYRAANSGEKVEKEVADLMVFQLAAASTGIELIDEYLPTIPKDEKYKIRMEGFAKVKKGLTGMLDGAISSLSERTFYSDSSIEKMVQGIRAYYAGFIPILSETVRTEFRLRIEKLAAKESNASVKQQLELLETAMKVDSTAAVNRTQPGK